MKFGQNFFLYQVPEWASHYVRYNQLKEECRKAIRKAALSQRAPDFGNVCLLLEASIDTFETFYMSRLANLKHIDVETRKRHDISPHSSSAIPGLERVPRWILHDLHDVFKELQDGLAKLQWYNRVNHEAVDRVFAKISRRRTLEGGGYRDLERWHKLKLACIKRCLSEKTRIDDIVDLVASYCRKIGSDISEQDGAHFTTTTVDRHLLYRVIISARNIPYVGLLGYDNGDKPIETKTISNGSRELFRSLVERLGDNKLKALRDVDALGRLPLHYSAMYGLMQISECIISTLTSNGKELGPAACHILTPDFQGYTPLHLAVFDGSIEHVRLLLDTVNTTKLDVNFVPRRLLSDILSELLRIAIRYQHHDVVTLLASRQIDINSLSSQGQTALYIASQSGNENYVSSLVSVPNIDVNICEPVHNWTPLFVACIHGHFGVVKQLLQAGADKDHKDHSGWTAGEHAAFRGHLGIAAELVSGISKSHSGLLSPTPFESARFPASGYDTGCSHLVINLGGMQNGRKVTAVDLDICSSEASTILPMDTLYSLQVTASDTHDVSYFASLPFLDDRVTEPFVFPVKDGGQIRVNFCLFRTTSTGGQKGRIVGGGTAFLRGHEHQYGERRESLTREFAVLILEKDTLHCMGTVTFTYLVARPYSGQVSPLPSQNYSNNKDGRIELVGHRGAGQNVPEREYLQVGENTVESFKSAWKQGASCVEFDVQLTRDLEPVIYHDFSMSESGTDIPIHDLTLKQFLHIAEAPFYGKDEQATFADDNVRRLAAIGFQEKVRSRSLTRMEDRYILEAEERMKHTVDFGKKGFKPNTRGNFIQGPLATLDELLTRLPESIGFNMEIKYPRLHEAKDAGVAPVAIEINTFVDAIIEKIYKLCGNRRITLSSFTPEVCILLSLKQNLYPVAFITNAGKQPVIDQEKRGASLQVAIRFAKRWKLAGLVLACETFLLCPRLIQYVKNAGLQCGSYGLLNNVPENVKMQAKAGIDVVIADRAGLIAKTLELI